MTNDLAAYAKLLARTREISFIDGAASLLSWDQETYMPPDVLPFRADLGQGNYASLLKWLREKIHAHGQRHQPQELMQSATGETTQAKHHLEYLKNKFC